MCRTGQEGGGARPGATAGANSCKGPPGANGASRNTWDQNAQQWARGAKRPNGARGASPGVEDQEPETDSGSSGQDGPGDAGGVTRAGAPGFTSAKVQLAMDLAKKGQSYNSVYGSNGGGPAPRAGLQRPAKRPALGGGAGGGAKASGYVPPFVNRALEPPGGGGNGGAGGGGEGESPYSERTQELLLGSDGQMPAEIQKLDPKIVDQVRCCRGCKCSF